MKTTISFSVALLARPGVSRAFLQQNGVNKRPGGDIVIPYHTAAGNPVSRECDGGKQYCRTRLHKAKPDGQRYVQPEGSKPYGYVAPAFAHVVASAGFDSLTITEGEFKALSLLEAGIPAVGIGGISCAFHDDDLVPGLREVFRENPWKRIYFLGDGDTSLIFDFSREAVKLGRKVSPIPVLLPRIGLDGPGKGIDDVREAIGAGAFPAYWATLVAKAEPVALKDEPEALAARLFLREKPETLSEVLR